MHQAHTHLGRLDVIVNNAGYGHFGAFEELSEADLREQLETNLFGAVWITQAALPLLRQQGAGHVIQLSSMAGVGAYQNLSAYHASNWALEAMSESLAAEVGPSGIKVTLIEPGLFATDWAGSSARVSTKMPEYDTVRHISENRLAGLTAGDPTAAAQALLEIVDAEHPPLRILFAPDGVSRASAVYEQRLQSVHEWRSVSERAHGDWSEEPSPVVRS